MEESIVLKGSVEDIIFENRDNGYTVFTIDTGEEEVVCVGTLERLNSGENVTLTGSWTMHLVYGKQFQVDYCEKTMPTTAEGIEKYLSSGLIKGIGPKTAKKIVDRFGEATFYVIEEKPDRLVEIRGITYEKALKISEVFKEQNGIRRAMIFMQSYGISPVYAMKIYKRYRENVYDIIKTDPYRLADDVFGIGFKMADAIAEKAGVLKNSPQRVRACIKYVLNNAAANGHTFLPLGVLVSQVAEMTDVGAEMAENAIVELQIEHVLRRENVEGETAIYLGKYYYAEMAVAKRLIELMEGFTDDRVVDTDFAISRFQMLNEMTLAKNQKEAVKEALTRGMLVITGGPGTGKTTIINAMIDIFADAGKKVVLAAPTGRAAKRITETCGLDAQTIHRLLGVGYIDDDTSVRNFEKDENDPIEADVIIIDESSMIDIMLMYGLLKAVKDGTKLILVGDVDQLPSVGCGNVLKDIIRSGRIPVVRLNEIFRQAAESAIILNAHRINTGEEPVINEKGTDFFFIKRGSAADTKKTVIELIKSRLPKYMNCDSMSDIQVMSPMRKGIVGVNELNTAIQQALNPKDDNKKEKLYRSITFREGDKVMQIKNNYNMSWKIFSSLGKCIDEGMGVFNGDQGVIERIDDDNEQMTVNFDDNKTAVYDYTQLDELELAYAVTIHKSQGSEYPVVVIPVHSGPPMLMTRNLLYTAVTRAKKLVVLVGNYEAVRGMIANNREVNRYTGLSVKIKNLYDFMNNEAVIEF
ncbi:MAG: ATP-dependent RecD-like DNA helicase [Lachnospiraceae bacterium]|nr:ATP-dependent RecD-like DNA helicase [Lachnospiraceae bacterium]